jgi:uncharacterized protein (DUF983 family)
MATATKCKTGFKVPCPHCGAVEGLTVKLHNLAVECGECSEEVTRDDLKQMIIDASRLMNWLDAASAM